MKANYLFVLVTMMGVLDTRNLPRAYDNNSDCHVNNSRWPLDCPLLTIKMYYDGDGTYFLNYSLPPTVSPPCNMRVTRCETSMCSCKCSCTPSNSGSSVEDWILLKDQKGTLKKIKPSDEGGCFQYSVFRNHSWQTSCCAYFPGSDDTLSPELPEYTASVSSSKTPPQDAKIDFVVPLISYSVTVVIILLVCFVPATFLYCKWRVKNSYLPIILPLAAATDSRVPVSTHDKSLIRILLVYTNPSRILREEVKLLKAILEKLLKCTVLDVNDCEGSILDCGNLERFMNQYADKVLAIFPRDEESSVEGLGLENFFSSYLSHLYPNVNHVLAVSLESFPIDNSDLSAVTRAVYSIPTQIQYLLRELDSSYPDSLPNQKEDLLRQLKSYLKDNAAQQNYGKYLEKCLNFCE